MSHSNWSRMTMFPTRTCSCIGFTSSPSMGLYYLNYVIYFFSWPTISFSNVPGRLCSSVRMRANSSRSQNGSFLSQRNWSLNLRPSISMSSFIGINKRFGYMDAPGWYVPVSAFLAGCSKVPGMPAPPVTNLPPTGCPMPKPLRSELSRSARLGTY